MKDKPKMRAVLIVDGRTAMRFPTAEDARAFVARHSKEMQARMRVEELK